MGTAIAAFALAWTLSGAATATPLPSRPWSGPLAVVPANPPTSFDLDDVRAEMIASPPVEERGSHSIFKLRHHVGAAMGYDQGVLHGSIGLYVTVAELGRWNLGITSPGIGLSRYRMFDPRRRTEFVKTETTLLVSLASVHFRGGYLQSLRKVWYVNFEQIYDARASLNGSQIGLSFSNR